MARAHGQEIKVVVTIGMTKRMTMFIGAAAVALVLVSLPLFGTPGFATLDARRATVDPVLRRDVGVAVATAADRALRSRIGYPEKLVADR